MSIALARRPSRRRKSGIRRGCPAPAEQKTREIYVPFSDLHVLLENQPKRVMLGRQEYEELLKRAKRRRKPTRRCRPLWRRPTIRSPPSSNGREIHGLLSVHVLEDGLHALPLDIGGVGIQSARLDGRDAAIGRDAAGRLLLFVEGAGEHRLTLEMVAPLETTAARQVLNFRLPRPAAASLRLTVPGDVELRSGADVISRTVETALKQTRFELLPREGDTSLVMTLNSHLQRQDRVVVARSVLIDEVAEAGETLHATVTLEILRRPVDQFQFAIPDGFEVTDVISPLLARWEVRQEGGRRVLDARLREPTTETIELRIAATGGAAKLGNWTAPRLEPLEVAGSVTVFGLVLEDRLRAESIAAEGLIPIDASRSGILPLHDAAGCRVYEPAGPRAVAAWYAPQGQYALRGPLRKAPGGNGRHQQPAVGRFRQGARDTRRAVDRAAGREAVHVRFGGPRRLASHGNQGRRRPAAHVRVRSGTVPVFVTGTVPVFVPAKTGLSP